MGLSNAELTYYDSNVLRLPADKRKEYHAQVDRLIAELSRTVRDQTEIKITKVVKAGSFAKYTILRKTAEDPVDVDVVFYISGKDVTKLASMAKLKCGRLAREVTDACLQYWGGMGYTADNAVSRAYRDTRLVSIGGGADEVMLSIICKLEGTLPGTSNRTKAP